MIDKEEPLAKLLISDEGWKPYAYEDTAGWLTIGVGHLIDKRKGGRISDRAILGLLEEDIAEKSLDLDRAFPWWRALSPARQAVLLSMAFNMGLGSLKRFTKMLAATEAGNFHDASAALLASPLWISQVGIGRVSRLARMLEVGEWLAP